MSILKDYQTIKNTLNNKPCDILEVKRCLHLIVDIMECWLETYEYTKDFDCLMSAIQKDYLYSGTIFRGITLSKSNIDWKESVDFDRIQSFSKEKSVAINFATNNMVTEGEDINIIKDSKDVIPVIIELVGNNIGIDLDRFCSDLIHICENILPDEDTEDLEEMLSYATDEKEVLIYPNDIQSDCVLNMYEYE